MIAGNGLLLQDYSQRDIKLAMDMDDEGKSLATDYKSVANKKPLATHYKIIAMVANL